MRLYFWVVLLKQQYQVVVHPKLHGIRKYMGQMPPPVPPIVAPLNYGCFAIRDVQIDPADKLKDRLGYTDEYQELFSKIPTTSEIRSKFRIESNRDTLGAILVAEGRINSNFKKPNPPKIGRTSPQKPTPRYGYTPIGNAIENRGKRFTPREKNTS